MDIMIKKGTNLNKIYGMAVLDVVYREREFDGMTEKVIRTYDIENKYTYKNPDTNVITTYMPTKWVTIDVLDNR